MNNFPKMYAPVTIEFSSLRNKLGNNYGVIFDCDELVQRKCRRVSTKYGWKWQIVDFEIIREYDYGVNADKEILDNYRMKLEFKVIT